MEELNSFELFTRNLLYLIGWIIHQLRFIFNGYTDTIGFASPLMWLGFGLFFAFATLHIFKRILRKG